MTHPRTIKNICAKFSSHNTKSDFTWDQTQLLDHKANDPQVPKGTDHPHWVVTHPWTIKNMCAKLSLLNWKSYLAIAWTWHFGPQGQWPAGTQYPWGADHSKWVVTNHWTIKNICAKFSSHNWKSDFTQDWTQLLDPRGNDPQAPSTQGHRPSKLGRDTPLDHKEYLCQI